MDIGEVVKVSGLPASTLRFYEKKGLIQSNGRNGLRRLFDFKVIQQLALISLGRNAGFSLDEIAKIFTPNGLEINRALLSAKADELDLKIQELKAVQNGLRHVIECSAPSHLECPKFQQLLRVAKKRRINPNKNLKIKFSK